MYFPNYNPLETITILFWHYLGKFWLVWKFKLIKFSLITLMKLRWTPEKIRKIVIVFLFWWENWEINESKKEIKNFNAENMWHFFPKNNFFDSFKLFTSITTKIKSKLSNIAPRIKNRDITAKIFAINYCERTLYFFGLCEYSVNKFLWIHCSLVIVHKSGPILRDNNQGGQ